jgi:hypothetical protein
MNKGFYITTNTTHSSVHWKRTLEIKRKRNCKAKCWNNRRHILISDP